MIWPAGSWDEGQPTSYQNQNSNPYYKGLIKILLQTFSFTGANVTVKHTKPMYSTWCSYYIDIGIFNCTTYSLYHSLFHWKIDQLLWNTLYLQTGQLFETRSTCQIYPGPHLEISSILSENVNNHIKLQCINYMCNRSDIALHREI